MVSTTARVVAGSVLAIGVVLTLHFLLTKKRKKRDDKDPEEKGKGDSSETEGKGGNKSTNDHQSDIQIHGKRKHPNDEFTNLDVQSPKKPHETSQSVPKDQTEAFESFRKELQHFLTEGVQDKDENVNQNAETTEVKNTEEKVKVESKIKENIVDPEINKDLKAGNIEAEKTTVSKTSSSQSSGPNDTSLVKQNLVQETITAESASKQASVPKDSETAKTQAPPSNDSSSVNAQRTLQTPKMNGESKTKNAPEPEEAMNDEGYKRYTEEEITDALLVSQMSPGILSGPNAAVLSALLTHPDPKMKETCLNGINRCSTFTRNQNLFREHGCLSRLSALLYQQKMSKSANPKIVSSVANAITNLSANVENQKKLEDCVATLIDLTLEDETGESVCLSSLQALTNLSITNQHHGHYTRVVQRLYDLVDTGAPKIKLQAAKVLVNLSCNPELVPNMLAAKAPSCLTDLLKQATEEELLLRWTTLLANVLTTVKEQKLTSASLPADDKAPSPETMYTALYGVNSGQLKSKVYLLTRHKNENICHQASKVYTSYH